MNPTEIVCTEDLVASLRDPELLSSHVDRRIYITSRPLGSEGATGKTQLGDLANDMLAKIIYFDRQTNQYAVTRNGRPPPPEEHVPDGDIGALVRSFVREAAGVQPVYITVTDLILGRGLETVRKVIPSRQVEMYCQHGPHPTARGVAFTRADCEASIGWGATLGILLGISAAVWIYVKFFYKPPPPDMLPDIRPIMLEQRHGARKLMLNDATHEDVRSALRNIR